MEGLREEEIYVYYAITLTILLTHIFILFYIIHHPILVQNPDQSGI
jgi:hypothetical protein